MEIMRITITEHFDEDGDIVTNYEIEPEDAALTQILGLLELTKDSLLHPPDDEYLGTE